MLNFYSKKSKSAYLLLLLLFFGFILRIHNLGKNSFWYDEIVHLKVSQYNVIDLLTAKKFDFGDPPLYFVILHYWIKIFGTSEFSVRFPSLIFGVASVFFIYFLGKKLFNKEVGLVSALLMSISPLLIYYSQETRQVTLVVLLSIISMIVFKQFIENKNAKNLALFTLISFLGCATHFSYLPILFFQNIYFILTYRGKISILIKWVLTQLIILLPTAYWIIKTTGYIFSGVKVHVRFPQFYQFLKYFFLNLLGIPYRLYFNSFIGFITNPFLIAVILLVNTILITLALLKIPWKQIKTKNISHFFKDNIVFLVLWFLLPIGMVFTIQKFISLYIHYLITIVPAYYILLSVGIQNLRRTYLKFSVIILLIYFSTIPLINFYSNPKNEQWKEVSRHVSENVHSGELIVLIDAYIADPFLHYYLGSNEIFIISRKQTHLAESLITNHDTIWVIISFEEWTDPGGLIQKEIQKYYDPIVEKHFVGVKITKYSLIA